MTRNGSNESKYKKEDASFDKTYDAEWGDYVCQLCAAPVDRLARENLQRDRLSTEEQQAGHVLQEPLLWVACHTMAAIPLGSLPHNGNNSSG